MTRTFVPSAAQVVEQGIHVFVRRRAAGGVLGLRLTDLAQEQRATRLIR